jgi:hypothetical protein
MDTDYSAHFTDIEAGRFRASPRELPDSLTAPITIQEQAELLSIPNKALVARLRARGNFEIARPVTPRDYPELFQYQGDETSMPPEFPDVLGAVDRAYQWAGGSRYWSPHGMTGYIISLWRTAVFYETLIARIQEQNQVRAGAGYERWYGTGEWWILRRESDAIVGTYSVLLMLADVARYRLATHSVFAFGPIQGTSTQLMRLGREYFRLMDATLSRLGNDGYMVIKATEPIIKGRALELAGCIIPEHNSYDLALAKLRSKGDKYHSSTADLDAFCQRITNWHDGRELFGLQKGSGFPMIDRAASCVDLRTIGSGVVDVQLQACIEMKWAVAGYLLDGLLKKNGSWPGFIVPPRPTSALGQMYHRRQRRAIPGTYPLSDWEWVRFAPLFKLDIRVDGYRSLDDKTTAAPAESTGLGLAGQLSGAQSRSVLERVITGDPQSPRILLNAIRQGNLPPTHRVCHLSLKGKEMKISGRLFAMFTFELREALSVMESALMKDIQPLMPQAQKALSVDECRNRLRLMTTRGNILVEGDLSRWNTQWKGYATMYVGEILDDLYGEYGLWDHLHDILSQLTVFLPTPEFKRDCPIDAAAFIEGRDCWRNHDSGFEGQAQTFWELCTFGMMENAWNASHVRHHDIGMGDNQCSEIEDPNRVVNITECLALVESKCREVGQIWKPDDCQAYRGGFTSGKIWYVNGEEFRCVAKHASAALVPSTEARASFSARVATPSTTMVSVTTSYSDPLIAFGLARWLTVAAIRLASQSNRYGVQFSQADEIDLLSIPSVLGGYTVPVLASFLIRGHADPVTDALASSEITGGLGIAAALRLLELPVPEGGARHLIEDPESIPTDRPSDPASSGKRVVRDVLVGTSASGRYGMALRELGVVFRDQLAASMTSGLQAHPSVYAELRKASHEGIADAIASRFDGSETARILASRSGVNLLHLIRRSDRGLSGYIKILIDSLRHQENLRLPVGSYQTARALRDKWGIEGSASVTTVSALSGWVTSLRPAEGYISAFKVSDRIPTTRGYYRGNITEVRMSRPAVEALTDTSLLRLLRHVIVMYSQVQPIGQLKAAFENVVWQLSGYDLRAIQHLYPTNYGGTVAHRLDRLERIRHGLACSHVVPGRLSVSSDGFGHSGLDLPVAIQEGLLLISCIASIRDTANSLEGPIYLEYDLNGVHEIQEAPVVGGAELWSRIGTPSRLPVLTVARIPYSITGGDGPTVIGVKAVITNRSSGVRPLVARVIAVCCKPGILVPGANTGAQIYERDRLDRTEVEGLDYDTIIRASACAVAYLASWEWMVGGGSNLRTLTGCLRRVAAIAAELFSRHLLQSPRHQPRLAAEGILAGLGSTGMSAAVGMIISTIALKAAEYVKNRSALPTQPVFPQVGVSFGQAVGISMGLVFFRAHARSPEGFAMIGFRKLIQMPEHDPESTIGGLLDVCDLDLVAPLERLLARRACYWIPSGPSELLREWRTRLVEPDRKDFLRAVGPQRSICAWSNGAGAMVKPTTLGCTLDASGPVLPHQRIRQALAVLSGDWQSSGAQYHRVLLQGSGPVLDCGTGDGGAASKFIQQGYRVVGLELKDTLPDDPTMLRSHVPSQVRVIGGDAMFSYSDWTFGPGGGDWYRVGRQAIDSHMPGIINLGLHEDSCTTPSILSPIVGSEWRGQLLVLVTGCRVHLEEMATVLSGLGFLVIFRPPVLSGSVQLIMSVTVETPIQHLLTQPVRCGIVLNAAGPSELGAPTEGNLPQRLRRVVFGRRFSEGGHSFTEALDAIRDLREAARIGTDNYVPRWELEGLIAATAKGECLLACAADPDSVDDIISAHQAAGTNCGGIVRGLAILTALVRATGFPPSRIPWMTDQDLTRRMSER